MSPEEQKGVVKKIKDRLGPEGLIGTCPFCKSPAEFSVGGNLWGLQKYEECMIIPGGPITPLVSLACAKCGFTMFFNALLLGVMTVNGELTL